MDTLLGLRYWKREERHAIVDLKRLSELVEMTAFVKDPDLGPISEGFVGSATLGNRDSHCVPWRSVVGLIFAPKGT